MQPNEEIQYIEIESQWAIGETKKGQDYSWSELIDLYSDLYSEYERLQEEFDDFKQNVEDNYKPISMSEQVGVSDKDFVEVL